MSHPVAIMKAMATNTDDAPVGSTDTTKEKRQRAGCEDGQQHRWLGIGAREVVCATIAWSADCGIGPAGVVTVRPALQPNSSVAFCSDHSGIGGSRAAAMRGPRIPPRSHICAGFAARTLTTRDMPLRSDARMYAETLSPNTGRTTPLPVEINRLQPRLHELVPAS